MRERARDRCSCSPSIHARFPLHDSCFPVSPSTMRRLLDLDRSRNQCRERDFLDCTRTRYPSCCVFWQFMNMRMGYDSIRSGWHVDTAKSRMRIAERHIDRVPRHASERIPKYMRVPVSSVLIPWPGRHVYRSQNGYRVYVAGICETGK